MTDAVLTHRAVDELVHRCLMPSCDPDAGHSVRGIVHTFAFDPEKIAQSKPAIVALLAELPDEFHASRGGGWSFLNACQDRHGNQWTDYHLQMEALFCLGIAAGLARWQLPRDLWEALPGGMPYVSVTVE
jgi:hypothetical protein